jgi:hypothetical protein
LSETIVAALIAVGGSVLLGGAGLMVTWGMVRQMVDEPAGAGGEGRGQDRDPARRGRQMPALAQAIEHMGERFAASIQNLADRFGERDGHIKDQLADIKEEQRIVRDELGVRRRRGANLSTGSR